MSLRLLVPGTFGSNSSGKIARGTCENCIGIDWSRSEKRRRGQINKRGNLVLYVRPAAVFYFQFNIWNSADIEIGSVLVQIPRHCCELSSPETFNRVQKKKKEKKERKKEERGKCIILCVSLGGLSLSAGIIGTSSGDGGRRAHSPALSRRPFHPVY